MNAKVWLVIVSLAVLGFSAGAVRAASFDVEVKLFQGITTCPTIMDESPPLNKDDIPIFINNFYENPDVFHLSLELPAGWQGFVKPDLIVDAGAKKQIDPIWITVPDVEPGTYEVALKAKSGQTGHEIRKTFNVEVLACHHVRLDATEAYKEVCQEEPEKAYVQVRISNNGGSSETFSLSVYHAGALIKWASGAASIAVPAGGQTMVNFTFSPPAGVLGEQTFTLVAKSTTSYAEDSVDVKLKFKDCYSFAAELRPQEVSVCSGEDGEFTLAIRNTGKSDAFKVTVPWLGLEESVTAAGNEEKELKFRASQGEKGRHTFDVMIASEKDKAGFAMLSGALNVQECRGLAIVVTPEGAEACSGEKVLYKVMVKNTGGVAEDVELAADLGVLETSSFSLGAKQIKVVDLVVDTRDFSGKRPVTVKAKSGVVEDQATVGVTVEDCYNATLGAEPGAVKLCPCDKADISVTLKNTGKLNDSYTVTLGGQTETAGIGAGETKDLKMPLEVPCDAAEPFNQTLRAGSARVTLEEEIAVELEKPGECYAVSMHDGDYVEVQSAKSFAVPVRVENAGKRGDTYHFTLAGPSWAYLQPPELSLEAGENDSVFVYISPPFDVVMGIHESSVKAKSAHAEASHKVVINVTEGLAGEAAGTGEGPAAEGNVTGGENVTMGPEEGEVVFNASVNESELPTAKVIQLEKTTRLVIVGVIVIAVILILVIRFMTLVK
jgi:uncharacterized membrane protein